MRKSKRKEGVGGDRVSLDQGRQPTWPAGVLVAGSHHQREDGDNTQGEPRDVALGGGQRVWRGGERLPFLIDHAT